MLRLFVIFVLLNNYLYAQTINIALSSNVSYAFFDLKKAFNKKYPKIKISSSLASSGKHSSLILHGAPYDIFISADMYYPQYLYEKKLALFKPKIYARGSLVLFSTKQQNFKKGLALISNDNIKKIALANTKTAPYGKASLSALKKENLFIKNKHKFIYASNISQTITYALSASDLAFIAKASLYSKKLRKYKKDIHWIELDDSLYPALNQGIILLKRANNNEAAKKFYDFMLDKEAKIILKKYGYNVND